MTLQLAGHRLRALSSTNSQNHPGMLHLKPREGPATSHALEKRDIGSCYLQRTRLSTTHREPPVLGLRYASSQYSNLP